MKRPINICSGQFGDLTLEELCKTMHEIGYNGIEIATQAHLDVRRVLTDAAYRDQIDETLNKYDMHIGAISAHLIGQCVGDNWDPRLDNFAPSALQGQSRGHPCLGYRGNEERRLCGKAPQCQGGHLLPGLSHLGDVVFLPADHA